MSSDNILWVEQPNVFLKLSEVFKLFSYEISQGNINIDDEFIGHGATYDEEDLKKFDFIKGSGWKL